MLPTTQDYKVALMIGSDSFRTLENVEVVMNPLYPDEPWYSTGGLAIVFKIRIQSKTYALKCFHKESPDRQYRLERIAAYIRNNPSEYWVEFDYLDNELWVESNGGGQGYPVVLMEWIEGKTLDNYLEEICEHSVGMTPHFKRLALKSLYFNFCNLAEWLLFSSAAHGDLKHDNIIVTQIGPLKLIDYDGMFIPEFQGLSATELGSPCYQHPTRKKENFSKDIDKFSVVVILITLYVIHISPYLFKKYYNGDGILFSESDLTNIGSSSLVNLIKSINSKFLKTLISILNKFDTLSTKVELKDIFENKERSEWEILLDDIDFNEKIISRNLLEIKATKSYYEMSVYKRKGQNIIQYHHEIVKFCNWNDLSKNVEFKWSIDWIEAFKSYWNWEHLSNNISLPWSSELIERYKDFLFWRGLSSNQSLPWNSELIQRFSARWDWRVLSSNTALVWTNEVIEQYREKWDWHELSHNQSLPWTEELIQQYYNKWDWKGISSNQVLLWSKALIEQFKDSWYWKVLSEHLPFTEDLIEQYKGKQSWISVFQNTQSTDIEKFIEQYYDRWDWYGLSINRSLPWTKDLIEKYKGSWNWLGLSVNTSLPWSQELIEQYKDKWHWNYLSTNQSLPWTVGLIEQYAGRWDWRKLSGNPALPWSKELKEKFKGRWFQYSYEIEKNKKAKVFFGSRLFNGYESW